MLPASHKGPGISFGAPDVCLTPVGPVIVPIPYPNFAAHAMASVFCPTVSVAQLPALNLASIIAMTTGDEAGVAHWTIMGPAAFTLGNPIVMVEGLPGINLTCLGTGNNGNLPVNAVVAPGAPAVLYTLATDAAPIVGGPASARALGSDDAVSLERLLAGPPLAGEGALLAGGVGYLAVRVFSWRLPAAADAAIVRLVADGMTTLVLDLRDCPGGELSAFVELAGDFLERGAHLVTMVDAEGDEVVYRSRRDPAHRFPLVLLVNDGTASAAELFAGAMKAHGRAVIAGEPTRGKDTGQILLAGPEGGVVAVTAARFTLPDGAVDALGRVAPG